MAGIVAIYLLIGVILNGGYVVYLELKNEAPEEDTPIEGVVRLLMFLIGVLYWPLFWVLTIYDIIKMRRSRR
jgi:hypothetical protein